MTTLLMTYLIVQSILIILILLLFTAPHPLVGKGKFLENFVYSFQQDYHLLLWSIPLSFVITIAILRVIIMAKIIDL